MKIKNKGFILITTLFFVLTITLLAYQALDDALLEIKLQQIFLQKN
jgi:hypothetical protein